MSTNLLSPTKARILRALLKGKKSANELSKILEINTNAVRKHLESLSQKGLVKHTFQVKGVGRPRKFYSITLEGRELFGTQYLTLLRIFLDFLQNKRDFEELMNYVSESVLNSVDQAQNLQRGSAHALVQVFNKLGFESEIMENAEGRFIVSRNCPVFRVATTHQRAICEHLHTTMVKKWLGDKAELKKCMVNGDEYCAHLIKA